MLIAKSQFDMRHTVIREKKSSFHVWQLKTSLQFDWHICIKMPGKVWIFFRHQTFICMKWTEDSHVSLRFFPGVICAIYHALFNTWAQIFFFPFFFEKIVFYRSKKTSRTWLDQFLRNFFYKNSFIYSFFFIPDSRFHKHMYSNTFSKNQVLKLF